MTTTLHHRPTVLITGGSRGIGLSCVRCLLSSWIGANVVSISRSFPSALKELKQTHPKSLVVVQGDVKNDEDNKRAVESAIQSFGSINGLILNSGIAQFERIDKNQSLEAWKEIFDVNFFSQVSILKHSLVHLRSSKGRVVFVSSTASIQGVSAMGGYSATKAAINSLSRTLSQEEPEITSISLRPGVVDTEMQAQLRSEGKDLMTEVIYKDCYNLFASSKIVKPEAPAEVIANLATRADRALSGKFLVWNSEELSAYQNPKNPRNPGEAFEWEKEARP